MAITTRLHRLVGTSSTKGYQDKRADRWADRIFVDGLTPGSASLDTAITSAVTALVSDGPPDTTLELANITSRWVRPDTVFVDGAYARGRTSKPTQAAWKLARSASGVYGLNYYQTAGAFDADGRPNGNVNNFSARGSPNPACSASAFSFQIRIERILIHTVLTTDPRAAVEDYVNSTNTNTVTLPQITNPSDSASGRSFGPYQLWLCAPNVEVVDTPYGLKYITDYEILHATGPGWIQQMLLPELGAFDPARVTGTIYLYDLRPTTPSWFVLPPTGLLINYVFPPKLRTWSQILPVHTP